MNVIAKFRCREVRAGEPMGVFEDGKLVGARWPTDVRLSPCSEHEIINPTKQDRLFGDATPNGEIHMTIMDREAARAFEPGRDYIVSFTPSPASKK